MSNVPAPAPPRVPDEDVPRPPHQQILLFGSSDPNRPRIVYDPEQESLDETALTVAMPRLCKRANRAYGGCRECAPTCRRLSPASARRVLTVTSRDNCRARQNENPEYRAVAAIRASRDSR
jgi:hypothetical protein